MRSLPKPTDDDGVEYVAGAVFKICISKVRNPDLRLRLRSVEADIAAAEVQYAASAAAAMLHTVPRMNNVAGRVNKDEMVRTYTGRMVAKSQPGRPVYDRLIAASPGGRCPLCSLGHVSALDHHLPKAEYPILAITPANLVPSCGWCQNAKDDAYPQIAAEQTLHPYFDSVDA